MTSCRSAAEGEPGDDLRVATRLAAAATVRSSRQVISTVCEGAGASVYMSDSPLQRLQRDVEVLKGHVMFDWDRTAELAGRFALGHGLRPDRPGVMAGRSVPLIPGRRSIRWVAR